MSYGKEGILKRLEIVEANEGINWVALPLNSDSEIVDKYFANFPVEGVKTAYEAMAGNTIVEAYKFTPGYTNARWNALTGIKAGESDNATIAEVITACRNGSLNIDDYAEQLNKLANQYISEEFGAVARTSCNSPKFLRQRGMVYDKKTKNWNRDWTCFRNLTCGTPKSIRRWPKCLYQCWRTAGNYNTNKGKYI